MVSIDPALAFDTRVTPSRKRRPSRWIALATIALVIGGIATDRSLIGAVIGLFVLVVPFEKLFPRHRQRIRRPLLGLDLTYAAASGPLSVLGFALAGVLAIASLVWIPALLLRPIVGLLPPTVTLVAGFVLFDAAVYWTHRLSHEVAFLWRFHKIHHSTEHLDWISGIRQHPFDGLIGVPAFVLLIVAGFDVEVGGVLLVVQTLAGLFLHANVRWRLKPLQKLIATPEFHHWHHANEVEAHHTNYSGLLPVWDLLFGTYRVPADQRPSVYGIDDELPDHMVGQLLEPLRGLRTARSVFRHPVRTARELRRSLRRGAGQVRHAVTRPTDRPVAGGPRVRAF